MSKARFPIGQMTTSYDGCCGVLFRERKGDVYCINSSLQSIIFRGRVSPAATPFDFSTNSRNQAAAAQILGWSAGGKNSGIVGLWDCGIVAKSRFLKFPDFSCFSLFEKWPKFHFSKAPPFDFSSIPGRSDSRLGRRGEKLAESRKVGKSRNRDF